MIRQVFPTVTAGSSSPAGEAEMLVSTGALDRAGDRVVPEGAILDNYLKNPVVLFGHHIDELPVGAATYVTMEPAEGIRLRWRWLEGDEFAGRVRRAWDQGVLRAASIGFLPRKQKQNAEGGYDFLAWELMEVSLVPVPANAMAIRRLATFGLNAFGRTPRTRVEDLCAAVRRGVQEGLAPGGAAIRRAVEAGVARALATTADRRKR